LLAASVSSPVRRAEELSPHHPGGDTEDLHVGRQHASCPNRRPQVKLESLSGRCALAKVFSSQTGYWAPSRHSWMKCKAL